jgi:hypothetical protein
VENEASDIEAEIHFYAFEEGVFEKTATGIGIWDGLRDGGDLNIPTNFPSMKLATWKLEYSSES